MTRINDLDLITMRHVIVTLMDISRCPRSKESIGVIRSERGGLKLPAERDRELRKTADARLLKV
jgi:hypothetical protein